ACGSLAFCPGEAGIAAALDNGVRGCIGEPHRERIALTRTTAFRPMLAGWTPQTKRAKWGSESRVCKVCKFCCPSNSEQTSCGRLELREGYQSLQAALHLALDCGAGAAARAAGSLAVPLVGSDQRRRTADPANHPA